MPVDHRHPPAVRDVGDQAQPQGEGGEGRAQGEQEHVRAELKRLGTEISDKSRNQSNVVVVLNLYKSKIINLDDTRSSWTHDANPLPANETSHLMMIPSNPAAIHYDAQ